MRRITVLKILGLAVLAVFLLLIIPPSRTAIFGAAAGISGFFENNTNGLMIVLIIAILMVPGAILIKYVLQRLELFGAKKMLGMGEKIYSVPEMREAALAEVRSIGVEDASLDSIDARNEKLAQIMSGVDLTHPLSPEDLEKCRRALNSCRKGRSLHVAAQFINCPTSDTPYSFFLLTTAPIYGYNKNAWRNIPDTMKWVIFVDRRTCECSWNPDINDWESAMGLLTEGLKAQALPIEKKKTLEKEITENILRGYGMKVGEESASKKEPEKEKHADDKKERG